MKKFSTRMTLLVVLCIFAIASISCGLQPKVEITPEIQKEIEEYNKTADKNGNTIIDMSKNPYFMEKQEGCTYQSVDTITYYSDVTKTKRHAGILLPNNYNKDKKYPVLYMLHGLGGNHKTWKNKGADIIIQNLQYFEGTADMIVVFPNSALNEDESVDGLSLVEQAKVYDKTEEDLVNNLMPYINEHYAVSTKRQDTAIVGNSMGGRNTLYTAFKHQKLFGYVGAFSSSHVLKNSQSSSILPSLLEDFVLDDNLEPFDITLCVGKQDNVCGGESYIIHDRMVQNGIKHVFYDMDGGHQNVVWQNALYNFVKHIFVDKEEQSN